MSTELDRMREVEAITDARYGHHARGQGGNEERRQAMARAGFDAVMGLGGRLANLVPCEICGLLDDQSPCGDHELEGER